MIYVLDEDERKKKKRDRAQSQWYDRIYSESLPDGLEIHSDGGYDLVVTLAKSRKQVCKIILRHEPVMKYRYVLFIELKDYQKAYREFKDYFDRLQLICESIVSGYRWQNNPFYKYTFYYTNYNDAENPSKWEAKAGYYAA